MRSFSGCARRGPGLVLAGRANPKAATRALMRAAAAAFFMLLAVAPSGAMAGEAATTHRAGDLIVYRFACHDADSMIALAERGGAGDLAAALVSQGKCFQNSGCIAATLESWIAGPYRPPRGTPGSVWRVRDQVGDIEFVWIDDSGGRHAARGEMAL